jgi:amidase
MKNSSPRSFGTALLIVCALCFAPMAHTAGLPLSCDKPAKAGKVELANATLEDLSSALAAKRATSVDLVRAYQQRIRNCDGELHSIISLNPAALDEAKRFDAERAAGKSRGPLHGVPIVIKDNIDIAGTVTTAGSLALAENLRERNAPLVDRLAAAGIIVIAKTNLSEWANFRSMWSSSGWSAVGGLAVNPHDPRRTACGSSSGSGAAVVAGLAPASIGTETNGSITCPSSINGLVGIKPTVGLISAEGIVPISHTQDTAGPMTLTVADTALLLAALADRKRPVEDYRGALDPNALKGTRLGVARFMNGFTPQTDAVFNAALEVLRAQGAELVEIEAFDFADIGEHELTLLLTEFKVGLNAYLATTPAAVKTRTLEDLIVFNASEPRETVHFGQDLFVRAQATEGLDDPKYVKAFERARLIAGKEGLDKLLSGNRVVALISPTVGPAWAIDLVNGDPSSIASSTMLSAVSGYPHLTVPMGDVSGLPVGMSIMGPAWSEKTLLAIGHAFEQARARRKDP